MQMTIIPPPGFRFRSPRAVLSFHWLGRRLVVALAATCLLSVTAGSTAAAGIQARVQAAQQLAVLLTMHPTYREPEARSPQVALVAARRPITGERTTLPVVGRSTGPGGVRWLQVMLPGRPDGSTGWIAQQGTRELVTGWHLVVDLAARRVVVYRDGHIVRAFRAVVGKPSTPTPTGRFFVEETVQMAAGQAGGPFALALSARSNVLQEFEGGSGQIALHGRDNLGGVLGTAASHGCVRLDTASIDWLAVRIGPGTPTTIYAGRHA
jgi:lipoprotein-anchoring transpeptidase ErfK/SrfK